MKLEKYISDLLYRYDLVIIPGFGGIIGHKKPARIDRDNYIFSPPHKDLSFNNQLKDNDGLLVSYVAAMENIDYNKALQFINNTVTQWYSDLKSNSRLKLEQIGIFNLVSGDKIIFLPLTSRNYLADAYGLSSFVYKPKKQLAVVRVENKESVLKPDTISVTKPETQQVVISKREPGSKKYKKSQSDYKFWKYAAIFVVGFGLFTAGIAVLRQQNQVEDTTYQKATFVLNKDFPAVKIDVKPNKKDDVSETKIIQEKYFVISGAFRNKANAIKLENKLNRSGFPAKIIGQNKYGLWLVAYQGFENKNQALEVLYQAKQRQKSAWLFVKK